MIALDCDDITAAIASVEHAEDVEPKEGHDVGINESTPAHTGEEEKGTSVTSGE